MFGGAATPQFTLPPLPRPAQYGNVLIDGPAESDQDAVGFSHWLHRTRYTCRVCHFEIGFAMVANETGITEAANRSGDYCGACRDGTTAFGYTDENCQRCHSGDADSSNRRFDELRKFPRAPFGNEIDWSRAVRDGLIEPRQSLEGGFEPLPFERNLELWANWSMISPALFPHDAHQVWHDCAECHPAPFNVKKKTTEHFEMRYILQGMFCGYCHLNVAFPIDDCWRCHPEMRRR
jgi:c(7)-type cytochrome triheme protein